MPEPVETSDPEGVDYGWVMQTTFVTTIVVGAPVVALLSTQASLPTWGSRVEFAIRVGAVVWILTALAVFAYAKRMDVETIETEEAESEAEAKAKKGKDDEE
ncbi:DUF5822 domain-containing protein [Halomontanus rarus]|uniref:DUF5822 domain-containing protein n=1 Tax=Halomontanus rarus TaxID=3034020 RepID=UPI0031F31BDD